MNKSKCAHVRCIVYLYYEFDMIMRFRQDIGFSCTGNEEGVILKPCLEAKRANMANLGGLSAPYF